MTEKQEKWIEEAYKFTQFHISAAQDWDVEAVFSPVSGFKAKYKSGLFVLMVTKVQHKLCFCFGRENPRNAYQDIFNKNMPSEMFYPDDDDINFNNDKKDITKIIDNLMNKIVGLNDALNKHIITMERQFISERDFDNSFENIVEEKNE